MTPEIEAMPFDELRTLHREIGALIAERRHQELQELKERASILGFTASDFIDQRTGKSKPKYRNPDNPSEVWTGRGKRPAWLVAKLDEGADIEDFAI